MKHQWQYESIRSVINDIDRDNITDESSIIEMLKNNKERLMYLVETHEQGYNEEYKYSISNPPYCESAIEELYSTSKAIADDLISTLAGRYYIPIIKLLID
jgi:hypothetical protein